MPSPFPGIDPYIEAQGHWPDFHAGFITYLRDVLDEGLPENYVAHLEEQVHLVKTPRESLAVVRPDLAVLRDPEVAPARQGPRGVGTLAPVSIPLETGVVEEVRETRIEVLRVPELTLVTVVELLSPSNKTGVGRAEYLEKRLALVDQPIHIVELDLLLAGRRLPMRGPLPPGNAYAFVSRSGRRPACDVYAWTIRDPLPVIPIPLAEPDPDVPLDLSSAFATAYKRGRYARILRYLQPLTLPLSADDRVWAEAIQSANRE
ncbi:MAG: DUF4058 family protein [Isosphaeraceae bacterium]